MDGSTRKAVSVMRDEITIDDDGNIDSSDPYVCGFVGNENAVTLDGCFTADGLEFILSKMRKALEWTTNPPTEDGWYWCYFAGAHEPLHCLPILLDQNREPWVDSEDNWQLQRITHWLGPLPIPDPPK
jgi:hypothetical protein